MKKIVVRRPGGFGALKIETGPSPSIAQGQVRVAVRAIGINFADCVVRMGLYKSARDYIGWPITPGFEFSGVISEVAHGVGDLAVGDEVFGVVRFGAYASEIVVDRAFVRRLPKGLDLAEAASFSVVFLTAWYALHHLGQVRAGERVLVHSAAGGVGSALCQLAKAAGAHVVGVVGSAHKVDSARAQGADSVIDKSREAWWRAARAQAPHGFDIALDANGAATLSKSFEQLAPMGRLVIYGFHTLLSHGGLPNPLRLLVQYLRTPRFDPMRMVDRNVSVHAFNLSYLFERRDLFETVLTDLVAKLESGAIRPLPVRTFPFEHVAEAHRTLQSGATTGKLVLSV